MTLGGWPGDAGTGEVWAATLDDDGSPGVVRLVRLPADPVRRGQAAVAARRLLELHHPHLVPVLAVEEVDDGLAVVTAEVPEAVSLRRLLAARGRLEPGEVVTVGLPVAQALAAAHAAGLVHGTVTSADILLEPNGRPQLAGLGVAALQAHVAGGPAPTAAADVYNLADLLLDTMARATGPDAAAVAVAVATALVPDPANRPTAADLASALAHSARPAPVQMISPPPPVSPPGEEPLPGGLGLPAAAGPGARDAEAYPVHAPGRPDEPGYQDDEHDDGYHGYGRGARAGDEGEDDVVDAVIIEPRDPDGPAAHGGVEDGRPVVEGAVVDPEVDVLPMLPLPEQTGARRPGPAGPVSPSRAGRGRGREPWPFPGGPPAGASQVGAAGTDAGSGQDIRPGARMGGARPGGRPGGVAGRGTAAAGRTRPQPPRMGSREGRGRGGLTRSRLLFLGVIGLVVITVAGVLLGSMGGGSSDESGTSAPGAVVPGGQAPGGSGPKPSGTAQATATQPPEKVWESVLAGLDAARGRAFEQVDEAALADVYEPGSAVYAADLALLRQIASQGAHVAGLSQHVLGLQIREQAADRVVLRVTDQVAAYAILDASGNVVARKEQEQPKRHDVTLVRTADGWRIAQRVEAS